LAIPPLNNSQRTLQNLLFSFHRVVNPGKTRQWLQALATVASTTVNLCFFNLPRFGQPFENAVNTSERVFVLSQIVTTRYQHIPYATRGSVRWPRPHHFTTRISQPYVRDAFYYFKVRANAVNQRRECRENKIELCNLEVEIIDLRLMCVALRLKVLNRPP